MTDRMMNYDLDGIFATRNQGQLISTTASQQKIVRTPGLTQIRGMSGYRNAPRNMRNTTLAEYQQTLRYTGTGDLPRSNMDAATARQIVNMTELMGGPSQIKDATTQASYDEAVAVFSGKKRASDDSVGLTYAAPLLSSGITLPLIGTISKTTAIVAGLGVAAIGVLLFLKFKKKA